MNVLQQLCDSEIPFSIDTSIVGLFRVSLGSDLTGIKAHYKNRNFRRAVKWLAQQAVIHYPTSSFAKAASEST